MNPIFFIISHPRRLCSRRRRYGVQSRLSVPALKGKRLELSTTNFVHVYSTAVARQSLTQRSKGQRSHGYENRHGRTVASDACCYGRVPLLPAWVCMSIRLPMFSSFYCIVLIILSHLLTARGHTRGRHNTYGGQY